MMEELNKDVAKELITILSYCENSIIANIPEDFLKQLNSLAADSAKEFYIDKNKVLMEQNISEECKNILGLIYYTFITHYHEKQSILNRWIENEKDSIYDAII